MNDANQPYARSAARAGIYPRHASALVREALEDTRVVVLSGARQVGKSTLARQIAAERGMAFLTFDDESLGNAAREDPVGFVAGLRGPVVIDEFQRAPGILLPIKRRVDENGTPGGFLLTGSADVFASRLAPDALTGRLETVRLWPLTQAEIVGSQGNFVDAVLASAPPRITGAPVGRSAFTEIASAGGFPEALRRGAGARRDRWFAGYLETSLSRDLRELSDALKLAEMPRLFRLLATQAAGELSYRSLATRLDITRDTVQAYVRLLELVFLTTTLPGWRPGLGAREIQRPKGYVVDTGLLAHVLAADDRSDDQVTGRLLENFVAMEVVRLADGSRTRPSVFHYRNGREEVDLILERRSGAIAGVEVKASATIRPRDWAALARLRDARGPSFLCGVVVYTGGQTIPLGDRLWAVPVSALWRP